MSTPARLTFHDFEEPVLAALWRAVEQEVHRYGGPDLATAVLVARTARRLREELPWANDGLVVRTVLLLKQAP